MKPSFKSMGLLAIAVTLAAAVFWASWPARQVQAIQDSEDFPPPFGLAEGQTARLTLLNIGETTIVGPEYRFLNSRGDTVAQSTDRIVVRPGQFRSFDFNPPPGLFDLGRAQVRAVVTAVGNPDTRNLRVSVEVFDTATGRTSFVIQPPPEGD